MELEDFNFEWFMKICKGVPEAIQELIEIWGVN